MRIFANASAAISASRATTRRATCAVLKIQPWARNGDVGGGAWVGRHLDLHCTAQGKALIANLPDEELDQLLAGRELAHFTHKTIVSLAALKAHLAEVRANGFSMNDEEHVYRVRAVAAPVVDSWGMVIAAISVRGSMQVTFMPARAR